MGDSVNIFQCCLMNIVQLNGINQIQTYSLQILKNKSIQFNTKLQEIWIRTRKSAEKETSKILSDISGSKNTI